MKTEHFFSKHGALLLTCTVAAATIFGGFRWSFPGSPGVVFDEKGTRAQRSVVVRLIEAGREHDLDGLLDLATGPENADTRSSAQWVMDTYGPAMGRDVKVRIHEPALVMWENTACLEFDDGRKLRVIMTEGPRSWPQEYGLDLAIFASPEEGTYDTYCEHEE